ncbi:hypothetical protein ACFVIY_28320 [Streptomyces sp. NPDC127166]|uniref:hypothetical protein n=1 Tax=Streptomyces sp. NPDC127166 TaxID=3345380 RepID=UPI003639520F
MLVPLSTGLGIAPALGASDVLYVDPAAEHRKLAEGFGARTTETVEPIRYGFGIAVETTRRFGRLALAVRSLAPQGICESAGNHFRPGDGRRPPRPVHHLADVVRAESSTNHSMTTSGWRCSGSSPHEREADRRGRFLTLTGAVPAHARSSSLREPRDRTSDPIQGFVGSRRRIPDSEH